MKIFGITLVALMACWQLGCLAHVGAEGTTIPGNAGDICERQCEHVDMVLVAVAIMADNVGCVCEPGGVSMPRGSSSATAGMATIMMQRRAQQEEQQQLQQ